MSGYVYPDPDMQGLLNAARRLSSSPSPSKPSSVSPRSSADSELRAAAGNSRPGSRSELLLESKRPSAVDNLIMEEQRRRLSEAGVNRRPSAAQVLTEDTDSFIIGMRVYVDGVKPGRIQFIGEAKFGPGEWAGVFLDEPIGKNDGMVMGTRYFTCEPRHGVFSRLFRLTREPIEGAQEILNQCKRFGYEIVDMPGDRRGSFNGGSRRGSMDRGSLSPHRSSTPESRSPRRTPEPYNRASPDAGAARRGSIGLGLDRRNSFGSERRGSLGIPARKFTPGKSPLASPSNAKMSTSIPIQRNISISRIDKDPDIERLANEARRLSMGGANLTDRRGSMGGGSVADRRGSTDSQSLNRRASENRLGVNNPVKPSSSPRLGLGRRQSEHLTENGRASSRDSRTNGRAGSRDRMTGRNSSRDRASPLHPNHICNSSKPPSFSRKQSEYLEGGRRGSYSDPTHSSLAKRDNSQTRRGSGAGFERRGSAAGFERRGSNAGYDSLPRRGSNFGGGYDSLPRRGSQAALEPRRDRRSSSARRNSVDEDAAEMQRRRLSEAGLRRPSATDLVLNENTDGLMVGQEVWVDGTKRGRIAYIGNVHFSKGEMAGVHLDEPIGKNNGTVGGILYFQTEPRHGIFSRLHRLCLYPLPDTEREE